MGEWLYKFRNPLLLAGIFISYLLHASNGLWVDDFWDHSAVVTELIKHPWQPKHPQLGNDLPHVFFTPYSLLVAMVAKICHLTSVEALSLFGLINASLQFYGLSRYIESLNVSFKSATFFYSVLLILFFWGVDPWNYSGFFHSNILNFSLPYPSAFATGLVLLAFAFNARYQSTRQYKYLLSLFVISAIVILTHAVAFIFLCAGLVAGSFGRNKGQITHLIALSIVMLLVLICALQWPYYPFDALVRGASDVYHPSNKGVYENIVKTTWPVLLSLPFIAKELWQKENRQIAITLILLICIYILAWRLHKYSYGRVISYIAILLQIVIAIKIATWDTRLFKNKHIKNTILVLIITLFVWSAMGQLKAASSRLLTVINSLYLKRTILNQQTFGQYVFLERKIQPGDLVLANVRASWIIPSFGAKVITMALPHAFVADHINRIESVNTFYAENTSLERRKEIIQKYQPSYILFEKAKDKNWQNIVQELTTGGAIKLVEENEDTALYKTDLSKFDDAKVKVE